MVTLCNPSDCAYYSYTLEASIMDSANT